MQLNALFYPTVQWDIKHAAALYHRDLLDLMVHPVSPELPAIP